MDLERRIAELEAALAAKEAEVAAKDAEVAARDERIAKLEEKLAQVLELLSQHSGNSNRPPSSDPPGKKDKNAAKRKRREKRKRGGQKGHAGTHRMLLPPEQVDTFVDLYPDECESCWKPLDPKPDAFAKRYQQTELSPLAPKVTEYRRHAVLCPCCGHKTRAAYDEAVIPRTAFGPRLMAVVVMLTGVYHLSRRKTVQLLDELLGVRISVGSVSAIEARMSEAVAPAVDEAFDAAMAAKVKHTDGTTWLQSGVLLALWTVATSAVTVFKILPNGRRVTLREHLLRSDRGILVSDRATALMFWEMGRRQICLAHLLRKFVAFSERDGPAGRFGHELLDYLGIVFQYWSELREGKLSRARFRAWMAPVRARFEALLERVIAADIRGMSGSCADILAHKEALWTFVDRDDVEPTNNHAERELRAFVLWRKRSFGTQSERGNLFAARIMSIAHTARKQGRDVLAFLTDCARASFDESGRAPSLLEA